MYKNFGNHYMNEKTHDFFMEKGYNKSNLPKVSGIRVWTIKGLEDYFNSLLVNEEGYTITKGNEPVHQTDISLKTFSIFVKHRFQLFEELYLEILKERGEVSPYVSISEIALGVKESYIVICHLLEIEKEVFEDEQGDRVFYKLKVEDTSGSFRAYIPGNLYAEEGPFLINEFVCLKGKKFLGKNNLIFFEVSEIISLGPIKKRVMHQKGDSTFLAISDLHFGSKKFNKGLWDVFIKWVWDNYKEEKIRYLFLPGDLVEGLYTYPGQVNSLTLFDKQAQYQKLALGLSELPREITIFLIPGNHDLVRLAEPQPNIFVPEFPPNVVSLNNPGEVVIEGIRVLMYHGYNFFSCWGQTGLQASNREDLLKIKHMMLRKRHLGPSFSGAGLMPVLEDTLFIKELPDIFLTGHIHSHAFSTSKELIMINCSTFQNRTDYQEQKGFFPDIGILSLIRPHRGEVEAIDLKKLI